MTNELILPPGFKAEDDLTKTNDRVTEMFGICQGLLERLNAHELRTGRGFQEMVQFGSHMEQKNGNLSLMLTRTLSRLKELEEENRVLKLKQRSLGQALKVVRNRQKKYQEKADLSATEVVMNEYVNQVCESE